jgi:hypothetical protein
MLLFLFSLLFINCTPSFAQEPEEVETKPIDTAIVQDINAPVDTVVVKKHSAHKASLYSMALPGLGQAYNKKYWKIPVIYAGFGFLAYNISKNNKEVKAFTEAYRFLSNGDSIPPNNKYANSGYDADQLLSGREYYMRNVELSVIFTAALYLLNIVDAAVDAHFFDYDISEDLSLNVQPIIIRTPQQPFGTGGIRLSMNF